MSLTTDQVTVGVKADDPVSIPNEDSDIPSEQGFVPAADEFDVIEVRNKQAISPVKVAPETRNHVNDRSEPENLAKDTTDFADSGEEASIKPLSIDTGDTCKRSTGTYDLSQDDCP